MVKFVFECVSIFVIVYFLSFRVYLYWYLRRICVFASPSGFTCCSLSSSPAGICLQSLAQIAESYPLPLSIDPDPPDGIFARISQFLPSFSVFLPQMHGKKCISMCIWIICKTDQLVKRNNGRKDLRYSSSWVLIIFNHNIFLLQHHYHPALI